jgi:hypothetical protein
MRQDCRLQSQTPISDNAFNYEVDSRVKEHVFY